MTGWEIIKLIKEHNAIQVRRAGDHKIAFLACEFSSLIRWHAIEVSSEYGDSLNKLFDTHTNWCYQYTVENFLRELLANDDWEKSLVCDCEHCLKFADQITYKEEE